MHDVDCLGCSFMPLTDSYVKVMDRKNTVLRGHSHLYTELTL